MSKHRLSAGTRNRVRLTVFGATLGAAVLSATGFATPDAAATPEKKAADAAAAAPVAVTKNGQEYRKVSAQAVIELAASQIGISENASGGGTKFHEWYMSSERARQTVARDGGSVRGYRNAAWCDMFVSWVGEKLGIRPTVGWDAWTVKHAEWFRSNGHWGYKAAPGAVVFFDWSGERRVSGIRHVGFVEKYLGKGKITTIEGNAGDGRVERRVRHISDIVGYGYPQYAA